MEPSLFDDFIAVYDDVLPAAFCQQLLEQFEASDKRIAGRTGHGVDASKKLSTDITLNLHQEWLPTLQRLLDLSYPALKDYLVRLRFPLIGALSPTVADPATGKPVNLSLDNWPQYGLPMVDQLVPYLYRYGNLNLQKYTAGEGGYFHWHSEIYPQDERCEPLHRVLLFMFYLNDVAVGGETEFYYQQQKISPKRGRMVIAPAGFTHTHRGNMPVSNDKYIATSWVMFQRAEQLYGKPQPATS
ncbi:2OG-Fe(II) oxygenase [Permianibacter sp. IMCC34836]|uniref:2OG-Fe(II) oxygenase n=1 Tax=Permianibacter fluminis TaxID=2738515 RepID=UPI00155415AC|nr:2OG-Fe(II) oxygenase [Permianibacter fluminis]NQD37528.1 2OG-Fe(II) oxygenase [Permianibacter fluminis]